MTSVEFRETMATWIEAVLAKYDPGTTYPVIPANDNGPRPAGTFFTVSWSPRRQRFGKASIRMPVESEGEVSGQIIANDWILSTEIRVKEGDSFLLELLISSLDWDSIYPTYFVAKGIAFYENGDVIDVPILDDDNRWVHEATVTIILGVAVRSDEEVSWIEDVQYTSNFEGGM